MQVQTLNDGVAEAITNTFSVGKSTTRPCPVAYLGRNEQMEAIHEGTKP
jgi:hypothetical protein